MKNGLALLEPISKAGFGIFSSMERPGHLPANAQAYGARQAGALFEAHTQRESVQAMQRSMDAQDVEKRHRIFLGWVLIFLLISGWDLQAQSCGSTPCAQIPNGNFSAFQLYGQAINDLSPMGGACNSPGDNGHVSCWRGSHGTPHITKIAGSAYSYSSYLSQVCMFAKMDGKSDGIVQDQLIVRDRLYFYSYDYKVYNPANQSDVVWQQALPYFGTLGQFRMKFVNKGPGFCALNTASEFPPVPAGSQQIDQLSNIAPMTGYATRTGCVKADNNYNGLWFHPQQNSGSTVNSQICIDNVKMYEVYAGKDTTVCNPALVTLGGGCATIPGATYSWSPATGLSNPNILNPVLNTALTGGGDHLYTLTVTAGGCSSSDDVLITVGAPIASAGPDLTICGSRGRRIGPSGFAPVSYAWSPATGLSSATEKNPIATPAVTTTYMVTVTDNFTGCTATDMVTVFVLPTNCNPRTSTICSQGAIGDNMPGVNYSWSVGTAGTGSLSCTNCPRPLVTPGVYSLTWSLVYTDAYGQTAACYMNCQDFWTVTSNCCDPSFSIKSSFVEGKNYYNLIATPAIDPLSPGALANGLGFYWDVMEVDANGVQIPNHWVQNPSCWWVSPAATVNKFYGYDGFATYSTNPPNTGFVCDNTYTIPGKFKAGSYYWIRRGIWSNTCPWTDFAVTVMECPGGTCSFTYLNELSRKFPNGSSEIFTADEIERIKAAYQQNTTGVEQAAPDGPSFRVYPNPSHGIFTVALGKELKEYSVFVYDVMGKVVFEKLHTSENILNVDLTNFSKGIYLVKVQSGNDVQVKRIMVE